MVLKAIYQETEGLKATNVSCDMKILWDFAFVLLRSCYFYSDAFKCTVRMKTICIQTYLSTTTWVSCFHKISIIHVIHFWSSEENQLVLAQSQCCCSDIIHSLVKERLILEWLWITSLQCTLAAVSNTLIHLVVFQEVECVVEIPIAQSIIQITGNARSKPVSNFLLCPGVYYW